MGCGRRGTFVEVFEPDIEMLAVGADEVEIAVEGVFLFDGRQGDSGRLVARSAHQDPQPVVQSGLLAQIEAEALLFAELKVAGNFAPLEHADLVGGMDQNRVDAVETVLKIVVHPVAGIVMDEAELGRPRRCRYVRSIARIWPGRDRAA